MFKQAQQVYSFFFPAPTSRDIINRFFSDPKDECNQKGLLAALVPLREATTSELENAGNAYGSDDFSNKLELKLQGLNLTVPEGKHSLVLDSIEELMTQQAKIATFAKAHEQGEEAFRTLNTLNVLHTIVREPQAPTSEVVAEAATL